MHSFKRSDKRPVDLPLVGRIMRERKGCYVCLIYFAHTRRHYVDEICYANTSKKAKEHLARLYPTISFVTR